MAHWEMRPFAAFSRRITAVGAQINEGHFQAPKSILSTCLHRTFQRWTLGEAAQDSLLFLR